MKIVVRILCLLGFLLIMACATIPPTPETPITLPVTFHDIWFRPTIDRPLFLVMTDTGTVVIGKNEVSFSGENGSINIPYTTMQEVSFKKIGTDFINNWVTIKYHQDNLEKYSLFSGGKALGWGGAGVAAQIFQTLDSTLQQRGQASIVQRK